VKQGELGEKYTLILLQSISCHTPQGSLTCHKILQHGADGFTSPPKDVVLQIFIPLKNPSSTAGFEPVNFGSSGKHDNH
jgi:hypothetical protein